MTGVAPQVELEGLAGRQRGLVELAALAALAGLVGLVVLVVLGVASVAGIVVAAFGVGLGVEVPGTAPSQVVLEPLAEQLCLQ